MADMKKELQKTVKAFRDAQETASDFPKAMMTAQQIRKGTATINCGRRETGKERAEKMIEYKPFIAWCEEFGAKIEGIEIMQEASYMAPQYQIRIKY